jgi:hypothetical protein
MFSSYVEFWRMDEAYKHCNSKCYLLFACLLALRFGRVERHCTALREEIILSNVTQGEHQILHERLS